MQTFMEAHTFSTIALHKSRIKSISRSPRGRGCYSAGDVHGKRRNPARVKLHIHVQIYTVSPFRHFAGITPTSADISRRYKEAICADERVVALGHGKIDLFRVMCLSNPVVIRSTRLGSLCTTQHTSDTGRYIIHNAHHKSQVSHNALCNYYPT